MAIICSLVIVDVLPELKYQYDVRQVGLTILFRASNHADDVVRDSNHFEANTATRRTKILGCSQRRILDAGSLGGRLR